METCPECQVIGDFVSRTTGKCNECYGTGQKLAFDGLAAAAPTVAQDPCPRCGGTGVCQMCGGKGHV